jgi:vacuolar-type H+-ATPase subunit E/Vma4
MSLREQMSASADREIAEIHADAALRISAIISSAHKESARILAEKEGEAARTCAKKLEIAHAEMKAAARLEKSRAFESLMDELTGKIYHILDARWRADFPICAFAAIMHGAAAMNTPEIDAEFPLAYKDIFEKQEHSLRAALGARSVLLRNVFFTLHARGGVIVKSTDGRRIMTATFEESVRRIEEKIRAECARRCGYDQT